MRRLIDRLIDRAEGLEAALAPRLPDPFVPPAEPGPQDAGVEAPALGPQVAAADATAWGPRPPAAVAADAPPRTAPAGPGAAGREAVAPAPPAAAAPMADREGPLRAEAAPSPDRVAEAPASAPGTEWVEREPREITAAAEARPGARETVIVERSSVLREMETPSSAPLPPLRTPEAREATPVAHAEAIAPLAGPLETRRAAPRREAWPARERPQPGRDGARGAAGESIAEAAPSVEIRIDTVEIRAAGPAARTAPPADASRRRGPSLTLDAYLAEKGRGR